MTTHVKVELRRCENCNLFLKRNPDYIEIESGVDEEYEFGTHGNVVRSVWQTKIEYRTCKFCGYDNKHEAS